MSDEERPILPTGIADCDVAARVGGIHILGVLHGQPLAIARLTGAITRYDPDVVAVEASAEAIIQYHPDNQDARWPPRDELEAAAFATDRRYDLLLAGIDTRDHEKTADFVQLDREIFTEMGVIESEEELTLSTYYELDLPMIRRWRNLTEQRIPDQFQTVLADRDEVMAGHLYALADDDDISTIVAAVGIQHLTGVLDLLRTPSKIPDNAVEVPPLAHYRLFPRESPNP